MNEKDGGGPAFPIPHQIVDMNDPMVKWGSKGMMLRDYFAAHAPVEIITGCMDDLLQAAAAEAYRYADAMLEARKR